MLFRSRKFEAIKLDISKTSVSFNKARTAANISAKDAAEKKALAQSAKVMADNALAAYKTAVALKSQNLTIKPFTVANTDTGQDLKSSVTSSDIAKLKLLAEQANTRYEQAKRVAEYAAKTAAKTLADFQNIKVILEDKVTSAKKYQETIVTLQDQLANQRSNLANTQIKTNVLNSKLLNSKAQVTERLNRLTIAQVEAQKDKVIAEKTMLAVIKFRKESQLTDKVAKANETAIAEAKKAANSVISSNESIHQIITPKIVQKPFNSYTLIITAIVVITITATVFTIAIRRKRRTINSSELVIEENDFEFNFDIDKILSEIKIKSEKKQKRKAPQKPKTKSTRKKRVTAKKKKG